MTICHDSNTVKETDVIEFEPLNHIHKQKKMYINLTFRICSE
jgi:hypothetical protein